MFTQAFHWWEFCRLRELPAAEPLEEREMLARLSFAGAMPRQGRERNERHRYSFPPQDTAIEAADKVVFTSQPRAVRARLQDSEHMRWANGLCNNYGMTLVKQATYSDLLKQMTGTKVTSLGGSKNRSNFGSSDVVYQLIGYDKALQPTDYHSLFPAACNAR